MVDIQLDNRIYAMQQKDLCPEASRLVHLADVAYLQDRNDEAYSLIEQAESVQELFESK